MKKSLVAYFSTSGTTAKVAKTLAKAAQADLNWMDRKSRSSVEMQDKAFRPALADTDAGIADYDVIFLGFPIWWYVAPTIIHTFLESYDFSGKTIVLFATSGGSDFGQTVKSLKESVSSETKILEGRLCNSSYDVKDLRQWLQALKF